MTNEQKQCLLKYMGYYPGEIDGKIGEISRKAIREFQNDFGGIKVDGIAGQETEEALLHAVANGITKKEPDPAPEETGSWWDDIKYFKRKEFRCFCGGKYCNGYPVEPSEGMVRILDKIREHFGVPIRVHSGIRCEKRNKAVGGVSNSQHLLGKAADISVPGHTPKEVAAYAETLIPKTGGIGIYNWGVHIDDRKNRSRWNG